MAWDFSYIWVYDGVGIYIYYFIRVEKGRYDHYGNFLKKKAYRLLIPYLFIVLVWVIPVHIYFYGNEDLFQKFLLGINPSQLWFLLMLFWAFALFWPLSRLADQKPRLVMLLFLLGYGIGLGTPLIPNLFNVRTGMQYLVFFYIGFLIRKYRCEHKLPCALLFLVHVVLFVLSLWLENQSGIVMRLANAGVDLLLHAVSAIMVFGVLQVILDRFEHSILTKLSVHSMTIYLIHQQLIYFTNQWFSGTLPPALLVGVNFCAAIAVSVSVSALTQKQPAIRFLFGNK